MKKILTYGIAAIALFGIANAVINDAEFDDAIDRAYESEMTKYSTQNEFMPLNTLTREQGAKMYAVFATKHLCLLPDQNIECVFSDTSTADPTLQPFLEQACQLGLFQGFDGKFMPKAPLTKAQAITVLARALDGKLDESVTPWWKNYFMYAQDNGLTKETDVYAIDKELSRYESLLMQYRARSEDCDDNTGEYSSELLEVLEDLFGEEPEVQEENGTGSSEIDTGDTSSTGSSGTGGV